MSMKSILILIILSSAFLLSYTSDCKHIYVAVEKEKMDEAALFTMMTAQHKDLVCVRCFKETKQQWNVWDNGGGGSSTLDIKLDVGCLTTCQDSLCKHRMVLTDIDSANLLKTRWEP